MSYCNTMFILRELMVLLTSRKIQTDHLENNIAAKINKGYKSKKFS